MITCLTSFWDENLWWIILLAILAVILIALIIVLLVKKNTSKKPIATLSDKATYLDALGGVNNIVDKKITGSRISIKLVDFDKADPKKLLEIGVSSYILMSGQLVLICKENAQEVYDRIFS